MNNDQRTPPEENAPASTGGVSTRGASSLMMDSNFVALNRSLLQWEWFGDSNTVHVLVYLMLDVNWKEGRCQGIVIKPGSTLSSREKIARNVGLTDKQVRLILDRLEKADVIVRERAGKGQLITLVNWAKYQSLSPTQGRQRANTWADKGPAVGPDEGRQRAAIEQGNNRTREQGKELKWPAFAGERCRSKWTEFVAYRIREKKSRYRSIETEQKALDLAVKYFPTGRMFVEGLDHAMARTWVFPVDPAEHKYPFTVEAAHNGSHNPRA